MYSLAIIFNNWDKAWSMKLTCYRMASLMTMFYSYNVTHADGAKFKLRLGWLSGNANRASLRDGQHSKQYYSEYRSTHCGDVIQKRV